MKRAIDERLQFLGRFKVVEPSIHQSATSKANTVLDTSQDGAGGGDEFFRDKTQYEREIAARLCGVWRQPRSQVCRGHQGDER